MKVQLFNVKDYININHLQEVKNAALFDRTGGPHPEGLLSNEIFGTSAKSRRETFAYINLHNHYLHPHVYKVITRMFRNIDSIIDGSKYYIINKKGVLEQNDNGETGIEFLYDNWEKIKWVRTDEVSRRNDIIDLITKHDKDEVFVQYFPVGPAYFRDIKTKKSGGGETDDVNRLYGKLIRYSSLIENKSMFSFQFNNTNYSIQMTLVEIYDFYKHKLEKKNGLIRRSLMGKSVDYCVRTVITAANYKSHKIEDQRISYEWSGVPISQACTLLYPFIVRYVMNFFRLEVINKENSKIIYDPATDTITSVPLIDPVSYFDERYVKKMIDSFQKDPESRFTKIEIPTEQTDRKSYLAFTGKRYDITNKAEISGTSNRAMTWTDLLYLAAVDSAKGKCVLATRYPILDEFGTFVTKIRITSTNKTIPMIVNGVVYENYPYVEPGIDPEKIGSKFIDTFTFSNSYLLGIDGDFDGDQVTVKVPFTQEANNECQEFMYRKENFLDASGKLIRGMENESLQTYYVLTKDPDTRSGTVPADVKKELLQITPNDVDMEFMMHYFGYIRDMESGKTSKINSDKLNPNDKMVLTKNEYPYIDGQTVSTTVGRYVFYKYLMEGLNVTNLIPFMNYALTAGKIEDMDATFAALLREDKIDTHTMIKYIDRRDWFALVMHSIITTSFTAKVIKTPKEVKDLKKELAKKYSKEIENGDVYTVDKIAKALINKEMEVLKDDIGLDLYTSGARGSVSNNLKNMNIIRGAILNTATGKFDIVMNALNDELDKKDIPASFNQIVVGSYARGVGTQEGGYMNKELLAACQNQVVDPDTDCGTKTTIEITVDKPTDFEYRYAHINGKPTLLTPETVGKYKGQKLKFYSPMACVGIKAQNHICEKCMGTFYPKVLGKTNVGLLTAKLASKITKMSLAKFHNSQVSVLEIDIDDMLL